MAMAASESANGCVNSLPKDGPVLSLMNKRLRALKKKYNRILQIEESKAQGKVINKEQEDVLKSKANVSVLIEEYERLRQPLSAAVKEELSEKEKQLEESHSARETKSDLEQPKVDSKEMENAGLESQGGSGSQQDEAPQPPSSSVSEEEMAELLKVLYFASLFDVTSQNDFASIMWTRMHERSSCLSYDYVTDDATKPLRDEDLDALSMFGSMMTSRPANATLSHKNALQNCVEHAKLWLRNSDKQIHPNHPVSYSDLRERLNKILSSEYFTMTPELQTVTQETAVAAATAAGQYVTHILVKENAAEGHSVQPDAATIYYSLQDQNLRDQQAYQTEEQVATIDSEGQFDPPKEGNSATHVLEADVTYDAQIDATKGHVDPDPSAELNTSTDQQSFQSSQNNQHTAHEDHQQRELGTEAQLSQVDSNRRDQQQQYYTQNGGTQRGYQNQRARGIGYGGRGRGYANGRGRGRRNNEALYNAVPTQRGYTNGRGQYYGQGNYYARNNNNGRGRGRRNSEMPYNMAPSQRSAIAATN